MRTLRTRAELRSALRSIRRAERTVGLVPTMGSLHEGHLALIRRAREDHDEVVVSLFVNARQFEDLGDLAAYPRDEVRDAALAAEAGADLLYAPPEAEVYPPGFAAQVRLHGPLVTTLEGAHRGPEHFHGVATVVTKLLTLVRPDTVYMGQKDAQQVLVVRRLIDDLDLDVRLEVVPTVREPDGLARSSRNVRLGPDDRERALSLTRALAAAEQAHAQGERDAAAVRAAALAAFRVPPSAQLEYLELVDATTLAPVAGLDGDVLVAVAARVGSVRLIDNTVLAASRRLR